MNEREAPAPSASSPSSASSPPRPAASPGGRRPRFSIVSAVYDVEPYLPAFIASIERQRVADDDLEIVAVDDGSTDGSLALLRDWARRSRFRVTVLTQENAGQGPARNLGLDHARGEWVTFTDPDDMLDRDFLRVADRFARAHPEVELMAGKPIVFREDVGRLADLHPRRMQYRLGNRLVDLDEEPNVFSGSTTVSLLRLDRIREHGIRFDPRIRPNFEDGHFAVHYLLTLERPRVGILRDARYLYRRRVAGTSTSQRSLAHAGRFTSVLEHGYLEVLDAARARYGHVPAWLQHVLIYELSWYLSADEKITSDIQLADELVPRFHELLGRVVRQLDPEVVAGHRVRRLRLVWADLFAHAYRDEDWHSRFVVRGRVDPDMGLVRVGYRFTGRPPEERFEVDGVDVPIAFSKTRSHRYYGRPVMDERVLWVPLGQSMRAFLDGEEVDVRMRWGRRWRNPRRAWSERLAIYRRMPASYVAAAVARRIRARAQRLWRPIERALLTLPPYAARFRRAWVVMDRVHNADDNGERLFEHLRANRPDINAWFVLAKESPDFARLRAAGERRLVAWGSRRWKALMLNAHWLISSHADRGIVEPPHLVRLAGGRRWKFGFLQHGVIKDDLSLWLNHREMELFVVSTADEYASVAGDGTSYVVTPKETRLTGLPRFDRLLAKGREVPEPERNLVIVAPTWRTRLTLPIDPATQRRAIDQRFWESDYHQSWMAILRSEAIAEAVARRGWTLGFMPHPNLQEILDQLDLPHHVVPLSFAGTDVQGLYARSALLVTDYSSVAFNIAYLDRPVVYFQFDREEMLRGGHMGRQGYFVYERDGFGPVAEDVAIAEAAIVASIDRGAHPAPEYQARIDRTFPNRDGRASERVVAAIEELSRPWQRPDAPPERRASGTAGRPVAAGAESAAEDPGVDTQAPDGDGPSKAQERDSVGP